MFICEKLSFLFHTLFVDEHSCWRLFATEDCYFILHECVVCLHINDLRQHNRAPGMHATRPRHTWRTLATRHVPGTGFGNGVSTLKQYFVLPKNGSKYYLKYTFFVFPVLGILGLGTSLLATYQAACLVQARGHPAHWNIHKCYKVHSTWDTQLQHKACTKARASSMLVHNWFVCLFV